MQYNCFEKCFAIYNYWLTERGSKYSLQTGLNTDICLSATHGALRWIVLSRILTADQISVAAADFCQRIRFVEISTEISVFCRFLDIPIDFSWDFCRRIKLLLKFLSRVLLIWLQAAIHFLLETTLHQVFSLYHKSLYHHICRFIWEVYSNIKDNLNLKITYQLLQLHQAANTNLWNHFHLKKPTSDERNN